MTESPDPSDSTDPTAVRSIAVHADDVVSAYEAAREGRHAVLRVTPPFAGRMRARLHVVSDADARDDHEAVHVDPADLLDDDAPAYPTPSGTEDELRDSDREYTPEAHREYHVDCVREWREAAKTHVVDRITLDTAEGPQQVDVKTLG